MLVRHRFIQLFLLFKENNGPRKCNHSTQIQWRPVISLSAFRRFRRRKIFFQQRRRRKGTVCRKTRKGQISLRLMKQESNWLKRSDKNGRDPRYSQQRHDIYLVMFMFLWTNKARKKGKQNMSMKETLIETLKSSCHRSLLERRRNKSKERV